MSLVRLHLQQFRNFDSLDLKPHRHFNVITGDNGSGKTSVLEAIYYLSTGRSFRASKLERIIQQACSGFTLFAQTEHHQMGIQRSAKDKSQTKFQGQNIPNHSQLAKALPTLLLAPNSFDFFTGGSKPRRAFIDWGVFQAEPTFFAHWQQVRKILQQRNQLLKQQASDTQFSAWDTALVDAGEAMTRMRSDYIDALKRVVTPILKLFALPDTLRFQYYQGWPEAEGLADALIRGRTQDLQSGFSHYGPHRADIRCRIGKVPVQDVLSRGQQKCLLCALKFAQAQLYFEHTQQQAIFLLDDLPSELDQINLKRVLKLLSEGDFQVFLTSISPENLIDYLPFDSWQQWPLKIGQIA